MSPIWALAGIEVYSGAYWAIIRSVVPIAFCSIVGNVGAQDDAITFRSDLFHPIDVEPGDQITVMLCYDQRIEEPLWHGLELQLSTAGELRSMEFIYNTKYFTGDGVGLYVGSFAGYQRLSYKEVEWPVDNVSRFPVGLQIGGRISMSGSFGDEFFYLWNFDGAVLDISARAGYVFGPDEFPEGNTLRNAYLSVGIGYGGIW